MRITDVRIRRLQFADSKLKATCSVVFDDSFVVHDLRIVEGVNGVFVAMPQRKLGDGQYRDLAHPITAGVREALQRTVLAAYYGTELQELTQGPAALPVQGQAQLALQEQAKPVPAPAEQQVVSAHQPVQEHPPLQEQPEQEPDLAAASV